MKKSFFKKIFIRRNILIAIVAIIISVVSMFTFSLARYSNNKNNVKISLKPNDIINKIVINKNEILLTDFVSGDLQIIKNNKEEVEYLVCVNPCDINLEISVIDNIDINFNNNDVTVQLDNEKYDLSNNSFIRFNSIFKITIDSITTLSILVFIISFVVTCFALYLFVKILDIMQKDKTKIWHIPLLIVSCFVIYLETIFYLMAINKFLTLLPIICMLGFVVYYLRFKFNNWQNVFLSFVVIVGTIMAFIIPPGNVPDEPAHFVRSFAEYNRYIHDECDNVNLPKNFEKLMHKYVHNVHSMREKHSGISYFSELLKNPEYNDLLEQSADYVNTKYLSFLPYLPSGIVNLLGRIINLPVYVVFLLSRLVNFIISTILCYYAIKITPKFKKLFVIVSLFPICLQQAAGIDMDYLTNSVSFIFIALILKFVYEDIKIKRKELLILIGVGLALALCKFGYFFLLLLIILIPNKNFKNKKVAILFKVLYLVIPIVISYFCNFGSVSTLNNKSDYYTIEKVVKDPINSAIMVAKTLVKRFDLDLFRGLFDGFGWSTKYHYALILASIASIYIILIFVKDDDEGSIKLKDRIIMLIVFGIIFAMLYAISFTEWTPIGSSSIDGLQSRYFIPIVLLFYMAISNNIIKLNIKDKYRFYCILIAIVQLLSITSIVVGFY